MDSLNPNGHVNGSGHALSKNRLAGILPTPISGLAAEEPALPPSGGAPPAQAAPADPFQGQQPLPLPHISPAAKFPIGLLPKALQPFLQSVALACNCPVDIPAVALLTLAGAAIGARRSLQIKDGYEAWPCLWAVLIARPGNRKSACVRYLAQPWYDEQAEHIEEFERQRKAFLYAKGNGENATEPVLSTDYVDCVTREQVAPLLRDNPLGFPVIRDEISGWISSMDEYKQGGKGSDKAFWLSLHSCGSTKVDRRNHPMPFFSARSIVPVCGGTQPDKLDLLRGTADCVDGFIDRFLPSFPEPNAPLGETWDAVTVQVREPWLRTVRFLWDLPLSKRRKKRPEARMVFLTDSGKEAWVEFTNWIAAKETEEGHEVVRNTLQKLRDYGARLALILHFLRHANHEAEAEDVDGQSMRRAHKLVRYFLSHIVKLHSAIDNDRRVGDAAHVLECIQRNRLTHFSRTDLFRKVRTRFRNRVHALDRPLAILVEHGYLVRLADEPGRPGPRSDRYRVNPAWSGEGRGPAAPSVPVFEPTAAGLAQAWVWCCQRLRNGQKADAPGDAEATFAELLRLGQRGEQLLGAVLDQARDRTEHLWQFKERVCGQRLRAYAPGSLGQPHRVPTEQSKIDLLAGRTIRCGAAGAAGGQGMGEEGVAPPAAPAAQPGPD